MRGYTYEKLKDLSGYIGTRPLLAAGFTNRQIAALVEEGILEKVCHGHYWVKNTAGGKPEAYKAVEVCLSDPKAVICADSACYYHGLIQTEPERLSIATSRNDRRKIGMKFPVTRHYYSEKRYQANVSWIESQWGKYAIYDLEKSVCDAIYFKKDIDGKIFECIIENYHRRQDKMVDRLMTYAERLRMLEDVKQYM